MKMMGNHHFIFEGTSIKNQSFNFWWAESTNFNSIDAPSFKLRWYIENGSLPNVMELVSKDLEGSVSTPGLGSLHSVLKLGGAVQF